MKSEYLRRHDGVGIELGERSVAASRQIERIVTETTRMMSGQR
jgi:hypothetical protein